MAFISLEFAAFFAVVAVVLFVLPAGARAAWLLIASLAFYMSFEPVFVVQILAAAAVGYVGALAIEAASSPQAKKMRLLLALALLLSNFVVLKYAAFLNDSLRALAGAAQIPYDVASRHFLLPIGLSFYTFLLIGYLVDVYRGARAERHVGLFALYVTFFPKVIAGPIERTSNLLAQLREPPRFDAKLATLGLQLILWGVFKKALIADRIAPLVNGVFDAPGEADGVMFTLAVFFYAFQLYCDFSGYTDMALGASAVLGYRLLPNFNRPYFATSIPDFWKRWHISLTSWLTDYVYNPLIRQRRLKVKLFTMMMMGLFATFIVSGFWHGAQWTFVIWGALHGLYVVASALTQKSRAKFTRSIGLAAHPRLHRAVRIAITFLLVCYAYIWFRANSVADALDVTSRLWTGWSHPLESAREFIDGGWFNLAICLFGIALVIAVESAQGRKVSMAAWVARWPVFFRWGLYYAAAMSVVLLAGGGAEQSFIYFRF